MAVEWKTKSTPDYKAKPCFVETHRSSSSKFVRKYQVDKDYKVQGSEEAMQVIQWQNVQYWIIKYKILTRL